MGRETSASGYRRAERKMLRGWHLNDRDLGRRSSFSVKRFSTRDGRKITDVYRDERLMKRVIKSFSKRGALFDVHPIRFGTSVSEERVFRRGLTERGMRAKPNYRQHGHLVKRSFGADSKSARYEVAHFPDAKRIPKNVLSHALKTGDLGNYKRNHPKKKF